VLQSGSHESYPNENSNSEDDSHSSDDDNPGLEDDSGEDNDPEKEDDYFVPWEYAEAAPHELDPSWTGGEGLGWNPDYWDLAPDRFRPWMWLQS
jgi:hypothetical protein